MQRLFSIVLFSLCFGMQTPRAFATDNELSKLARGDRAVMQKLLAIDPKLLWMMGAGEHVGSIRLSPQGATTPAIALLPQLPALSTLYLHRDFSRQHIAWRPGNLAPLSRCTALRDLRLAIAEGHSAETWATLPVLEQVTAIHLFDQATGRIPLLDRFPQATVVVVWTDKQEQFNTDQFGKLQQLEYLQLHLESSSWNGQGLSELKSSPRLTRLMIGGEGLKDVALREISEIPSLKDLTLISGTFTRAGFEALTTLESFRCQGRWLTDEMLTGLVNCRHLKTLEVSAVNGSCFAVLAKLPLEEIQCPELTLENIHLLKPCKTLKRLQTIVLTKEERETQQVAWRAIGQKASLKQIWGGNKGDDPKSGK